MCKGNQANWLAEMRQRKFGGRLKDWKIQIFKKLIINYLVNIHIRYFANRK
jgi:hypothetical protein